MQRIYWNNIYFHLFVLFTGNSWEKTVLFFLLIYFYFLLTIPHFSLIGQEILFFSDILIMQCIYWNNFYFHLFILSSFFTTTILNWCLFKKIGTGIFFSFLASDPVHRQQKNLMGKTVLFFQCIFNKGMVNLKKVGRFSICLDFGPNLDPNLKKRKKYNKFCKTEL
jgi:hypothetical protein